MDKTIVIVVSPLGLGHVTRQIALKDELIRLDNEINIKFVCTEEQERLTEKSIITSDRIIIERIPLVPKITMNNWLEVDVGSTVDSYRRSWEFDTQIRDDMEWGRILHGSDLIINDIECIHNPLVGKMDIPIVNISNFTWSDILMNLDQKDLANAYANWEQLANYDIRLPMSTECMGMSNPVDVGLLTREINWNKVEEIKQKLNYPIVFFSLSRNNWNYDFSYIFESLLEEGYSIITSERFAKTKSSLLTFSNLEPNVQNFVASADLVIGKIGYGLCSEILTTGIPFIHFIRNQFAEDEALSREILARKQGIALREQISPKRLLDLIKSFKLQKFNKVVPENEKIAQMIISLLN